MVYRVIDHLDLRLPDFDIVGLFDRVIKELVGCRSNISKDKVRTMVKQEIFLLQCMIKWYVTTGWRPPVVVEVIVFVCELNEVEVSLEDLASQLNVVTAPNDKKRERTSKYDFCMDTTDFWCGDLELSKKLFLNKILEKDVGLNAMPPSFLNGCLKTQRRKEKIEAAKKRIEKIRRPSMAANESGDLCVRLTVCSSKTKRRDTDWEDFVIETLLLHQVKEEEIEKGNYNTLLDLHVFNY
ncbi:hypothetical protein L6452_08039 [Arctium lappa]|uniref:Uncharacterized protein n=1 Tax=Arctium lappa TaxID=4217 RepID=A0ACB9DGG8_ARCLA|nr:hypothetical protein L6452_08039 [Arctium lappa]